MMKDRKYFIECLKLAGTCERLKMELAQMNQELKKITWWICKQTGMV